MISHPTTQFNCKIQSLPGMAAPVSSLGKLIQLSNRLKRILKRRVNFLMNVLSDALNSNASLQSLDDAKTIAAVTNLNPGDMVQVKSRQAIQATLNHWNQLKGCAFMEEMWEYCNTKQWVRKRVEKFLDERDYLIKKTQGIVILKDVICKGTKDFGTCDRSCFFFWREGWLEKVN